MRQFRRLFTLASSATLLFSSLLMGGFAPLAHAASTITWSGGACPATDCNWSNTANWVGGVVPANGDGVVFDVSTLTTFETVVNDISNLSLASLTIQGTNASDYNFAFSNSSNSLTLTGGISTNNSQVADLFFPVVLGGNVTVNTISGGIIFEQTVSGSGTITKSGAGFVNFATDNTFTGDVTATGGSVELQTVDALGQSANQLTVNDGADVSIGGCSGNFTFTHNITLTGASSNPSGELPIAKLSTGGVCGGGDADENYGGAISDQQMVLSGTVTLGSDVVFGAYAKTTTITGALSGAHSFILPDNWSGSLVISSSSNTSSMVNGTYTPPPLTQTLSDDQSSHGVYIVGDAIITIDGKRGDTSVGAGGKLEGNGTVGALYIATGGTIAPGHSPGCLTSNDLTMNGTYQVEIGGTDPCTGYDQLKVTGAVDVTGGTLNVTPYNDFKAFKKGQTFLIISNDAADAVTGTFSGLAEGTTFKLDNGTVLGISYTGGDGNDVVLTVQNVPATPDTGFAAVAAHPLTGLTITLVTAGILVGLAQRSRKGSIRH